MSRGACVERLARVTRARGQGPEVDKRARLDRGRGRHTHRPELHEVAQLTAVRLPRLIKVRSNVLRRGGRRTSRYGKRRMATQGEAKKGRGREGEKKVRLFTCTRAAWMSAAPPRLAGSTTMPPRVAL